MTASQEGIQT